jgi:hypothetical protein
MCSGFLGLWAKGKGPFTWLDIYQAAIERFDVDDVKDTFFAIPGEIECLVPWSKLPEKRTRLDI